MRGLKEIGLAEGACTQRTKLLSQITEHINNVSQLAAEMVEARKVCNNIEKTREKAIGYCEKVKEAYFDNIRYNVDKLELLIGDQYWLLPKYREMLFLR